MEIEQCAQDYYKNRCEPSLRVRALEAFCSEKDRCMMQDTQIKNTKIMVTLVAEIINDFFEPLSLKAIAFIILIFIGLFMISGFIGKRETII